MNKPIIIGLGEVLWDMLPEGKQLGGAPANVAFHASQLGGDAFVLSAVGNDVLGLEIIDTLERKDIHYLLSQTKQPTGTVDVILKQGIPEYTIVENVAWDNIQFTDEVKVLSQQAAAVCFGSLAQRSPQSRETIQRVLEELPVNAVKLFDINIRQHFYTKEIISNSLHACNILKINDEELDLLTDLLKLPSNEMAKLDFLLGKYKIQLIALTKGEKGSLLYNGNELSQLDIQQVHVADTIGAGDSFSATLIMGLIKGESIRMIHKQANSISAFVCMQHGATPTLPVELKY